MPRQSVFSKAFSVRQKQWESEQASELWKCENYFLLTKCGCTLANGKPCSTLFSRKYLIDTKTQSFLLSLDQLDMLLLGSVAPTVCDDDGVVQQRDHSPVKRQIATIYCLHKGYCVCRNTFILMHGYSKHKVHAIKNVKNTLNGKDYH